MFKLIILCLESFVVGFGWVFFPKRGRESVHIVSCLHGILLFDYVFLRIEDGLRGQVLCCGEKKVRFCIPS